MHDDLKILIVDSNPNIRETLRDLLEPKGFHVRTAGDGTEALRCFDQTAFDLVFSGLHIPRMGGLELLNRLKERLNEVFVVLLTGNRTTELAVKEANQAPFDYILKPLDQKRLFALIDRVA